MVLKLHISRMDLSLSFLAGAAVVKGAGPPAGAAPAGGRSTSPHVADEAPDVDIGRSLCKQAWPERFSIYTGRFNEGIDLILCDRHLIVMQDEG